MVLFHPCKLWSQSNEFLDKIYALSKIEFFIKIVKDLNLHISTKIVNKKFLSCVISQLFVWCDVGEKSERKEKETPNPIKFFSLTFLHLRISIFSFPMALCINFNFFSSLLVYTIPLTGKLTF